MLRRSIRKFYYFFPVCIRSKLKRCKHFFVNIFYTIQCIPIWLLHDFFFVDSCFLFFFSLSLSLSLTSLNWNPPCVCVCVCAYCFIPVDDFSRSSSRSDHVNVCACVWVGVDVQRENGEWMEKKNKHEKRRLMTGFRCRQERWKRRND